MFGLLIFISFILGFALITVWLNSKVKTNDNDMVDRINNILPQTQCGQCNYPGCLPYAKAIANQEAPINQCPPGGQEGVDALAELLNIDSLPLNEEHGEAMTKATVVEIIEPQCIGCTLCIKACPVDAIIGSSKHMHTVIEDKCTGCNLCIEPCPVDCIVIKEAKPKINEWAVPMPNRIPLRQVK